MPSRNTHKYLSMTQAGMAAYMHDCADECSMPSSPQPQWLPGPTA
jgi:hypothetical protein